MNTTGREEGTDRGNSEARIERWEEINAEHLDRARNMFDEVNRLDKDDIASLSVALRLLRSIVRR
jgi:glutamate dehydrogenase